MRIFWDMTIGLVLNDAEITGGAPHGNLSTDE
jgi:hypothetical protein